MAQIYFAAEDAAQIRSLQEQIQEQQAAVQKTVESNDTANIAPAVNRLQALTKAMDALVSTSAMVKRNLADDMEAVATAYRDKIKDILNYMTKMGALQQELADAKNPAPANIAQQEKSQEEQPPKRSVGEIEAEIATVQTEMTESLDADMFPETDTFLQKMVDQLTALRDKVIEESGDKSTEQVNTINKALEGVVKVKKMITASEYTKLGTEFTSCAKSIGAVSGALGQMGDALGDSASDFIDTTQQILSVGQSIIGAIGAIVTATGTGMKVSSAGAVTAVKTVEMASAILMIITTVIQVATAIASLFNDDKRLKKLQEESKIIENQLKFIRENSAAVAIEANVKAIDQLAAAYNACAESLRRYIFTGKGPLVPELRDNQEVVNKLIASYTELGYSVGKSLGEEKFASARGQLENLVAQQKELYLQLNAEQSKKKQDDNAIQEYQQKIQKLGAEIMTVLSKMTEEIIGGSAQKIAEQLGSAFIDAFKSGEDAASAWSDKVDTLVADIVKRMLINKLVEPMIGDVFDKYQRMWFSNGNYIGTDALLASLGGFKDDMNGAKEKLEEFINGIKNDNAFKELLGASDTTQGGSSQGGLETMSQDTADELNGRFTDMQAKTTGILAMTATIAGHNQLMLPIQEAARNIAAETRDYAIEGYMQLAQIAENTAAVIAPIRNMAMQINTISTRIKEL